LSTSEKKIDGIVERLGSIEALLQRQSTVEASDLNLIGCAKDYSSLSTTVTTPSASSLAPQRRATNDTEIVDATTSTHSAVASKLVENALENTPLAYQSTELAHALNHLKDMVAGIKDNPAPTAEYSTVRGSINVEPPTLKEVQGLVSKAEGPSQPHERHS
jgi:hypothetical protein